MRPYLNASTPLPEPPAPADAIDWRESGPLELLDFVVDPGPNTLTLTLSLTRTLTLTGTLALTLTLTPTLTLTLALSR